MADQLADCSDTQVIEALRPMKVVQCVKAISAFVGNIHKNNPKMIMILKIVGITIYLQICIRLGRQSIVLQKQQHLLPGYQCL